MKTLIFDIETDGLLDKLTKVHSLVIKDLETGLYFSCADQDGYIPIREGVKLLASADTIVGHNIICFDIPALARVYPDIAISKPVMRDTLVLSRLIWPNRRDIDYSLRYKCALPSRMFGSHSLKAWGYRLRDYKDSFGDTSDWCHWSKEMQVYCEQDVHVTALLWDKIATAKYSEEAIKLEHEFQEIIFKQETAGVMFDKKAAVALYSSLVGRREEIEEALQSEFPPEDKGEWFVPKVNNKTKGHVKGEKVWKEKIVPFNPSSRDHIAERLKAKYGWEPVEFTAKNKPQIDDSVLGSLPYPEAAMLAEYLMIQKRISQIAEGQQAWLKHEENGYIHGRVNTNGAVTGRCTHTNPNMAQVPAVGAPYGHECRSLFIAPEGYSMLGCDASGLELRCLSHYLAAYDGGAYRDVVLHGDIHTTNQKAAGLATRAEAKRFIYAYLYGAGDALIGKLIAPDANEEEQKATGKKVKKRFLAKTPALAKLIKEVQSKAGKANHLRGLDGRILPVRSQHSALNLLLQSAGAIVMKAATCILWNDIYSAGYEYGKDVTQVLHIHDEFQLYVRKGIEESIGEIAVNAIRKAGEHFKFRCPLDGEYKIGRNWAETH